MSHWLTCLSVIWALGAQEQQVSEAEVGRMARMYTHQKKKANAGTLTFKKIQLRDYTMNSYEMKLHGQYLEPEEEKSFGKDWDGNDIYEGTSISTLTANS